MGHGFLFHGRCPEPRSIARPLSRLSQSRRSHEFRAQTPAGRSLRGAVGADRDRPPARVAAGRGHGATATRGREVGIDRAQWRRHPERDGPHVRMEGRVRDERAFPARVGAAVRSRGLEEPRRDRRRARGSDRAHGGPMDRPRQEPYDGHAAVVGRGRSRSRLRTAGRVRGAHGIRAAPVLEPGGAVTARRGLAHRPRHPRRRGPASHSSGGGLRHRSVAG